MNVISTLASRSEESAEAANRRILVVDDNRAIHEDFRKILCDTAEPTSDLDTSETLLFGEGPTTPGDVYEFDSAYQGNEALDLVRHAAGIHRPYTVAFVDLRMPPGMDGVETTRRIWEIDPHVQIVMCTAYADYTWDEISAALQTPDQFLIIKKPFEFIEIRQLVTALTAKWQLARHLQRQMELLRRETRRTRMIIESANEAFVETDEQGNILQWNAEAESLFGWKAEAAIGQSLTTSICANDPDRGAVEKWLSTTHEGQRLEMMARRQDGESLPIEVSISRVVNATGTTFSAFAHDISLRPVFDAQFASPQQAESIGQLATGIAQEINSPMQYVGDNARFLMEAFDDLAGLLESCQELAEGSQRDRALEDVKAAMRRADLDLLREETPEAVQQSREGIEHVARIVRVIKEFCEPPCQEPALALLHKIIDSTITVSRNEWSRVAKTVTHYDRTLPTVPCLPALLKQAVLNLLINATQAIEAVVDPDKGETGIITFTTRRDGDWAQMRISDTGQGIAEQDLTRIFDPYFTTKNSIAAKGQGLAAVYGTVVEKHGGTIEVESTPGEGTTFIIRLPLASESEENGMVQKGVRYLCRDGPEGASHKGT